LIARTEGNPFFLEESVRTLVETRVLAGESGAYRLAKPLASIQVPATVQAILAARIDRLPAAEKRLLQTAAVIGTEVPLPLLQAIAEMSEEELRRGLAHLQAAEFLYETSLFPELVYTFKHALTHEVAYGSLLQERRRDLHAHIVEALEALYPNRLAEQVERLAHHAFRGEMWDKALTYFRQAGAKAGMRPAYWEAVACFEQALVALIHLSKSRDTLEEAFDLRLDLSSVLHPLGEIERMRDYLREAEILAETMNDQRRLGQISNRMITSCYQMGDYGRALASGQRALAIGETLGDVRLQVQANGALCLPYHMLGDYGQVIAHFRTAVSLGGSVSIASRAWLSRSCAELGAFAEGITHGEEGIRMAEAVDQPYNLVSACSGVGYLYLHQGDLRKAITVLDRSVELCHIWQIQLLFPGVASALGAAYAMAGRVIEALPLLEQAVEQAASIRFIAHLSRGAASLSEGYLLAGRTDEAMSLAQRALEHARQHNERGNQAWALRLLGEITMRRDPPDGDQAAAHYRQALALAEELGMRPLQAHCRLGLGTLYTKIGQREQACAELSAAIELYRAMEMTFWLPQAEAALVQVV
jgi:tetratricopeptide (TPR) repeat protein